LPIATSSSRRSDSLHSDLAPYAGPFTYPGDFFFNQPQASVSFFEDLLAWPVRWFGLEWAMLGGYLLAQALILLCLYSLAVRLVRAGQPTWR